MKVCSVCNKENNNVEGNFCIFCGGKLIEKPDNNKNEIKKEEKRVSKNNEKQKNNNINSDINKKFKIALIVLIIVLIIVSGIAIYLKISDNTSELNEEISNLKKQNREKDINKELINLKNNFSDKIIGIPKDLAYIEGKDYEDYIENMIKCQNMAFENRRLISQDILDFLKIEAIDKFDTVHN